MYRQYYVKKITIDKSWKMLYQINLRRELFFTGSCELTIISPTYSEQKLVMLQSSRDLQVYCQPWVKMGK